MSNIYSHFKSFIEVFLFLLLLGLFISCSDEKIAQETGEAKKVKILDKEKVKENRKTKLNLGEIMGRTWKPPFSTNLIAKWGTPITLEGTNNKVWIAYFPKGNFTVLSQKGDIQTLDFVKEGKVLDWSKELKILGLN